MSDGMRPKNAPKVREWTLVWLRERVKYQHHAVLTKYLMHRTLEQKWEADIDGLTIEEIVSRGFSVHRGHTSVPMDAIKLFRNLPDAPFHVVASLCRASRERDRMVDELARAVRRKYPDGPPSQEMADVVGESVARQVMES